MATEIVDDIKVSTIEISSESGLNLSNYDARLKHTGAGTFTLTSTSLLDNAISIYLPNGGLDVDVEKTIDFKALDTTENSITLQALAGGVGITAVKNIRLTSTTESINLITDVGDINFESTSSINIVSGLSDCDAINVVASLGGINTFAQNILTSCGQEPFFPFNKAKTDISPQLSNIMNKISPHKEIISLQQDKLNANSLLCPVGVYSQVADYLMATIAERSYSNIDNNTPGVILASINSATVINAVGVSGLQGETGYINSDLILYTEGALMMDSSGVSGLLIGTNYTVPISVGTTANTTTINGDLTVSGNFTVNGYSVQNNVTVFTSEDPVFYLNTGCTDVNDKNIGFIGERGTAENVGWVWKESADEWIAFGTDSNGVDNINTDVNNYRPARFGGLNVVSDTSRGPTATVFNVDVNGQININTDSTSINIGNTYSDVPINIGTTSSNIKINSNNFNLFSQSDIGITSNNNCNIFSQSNIGITAVGNINIGTTGSVNITTISGNSITNTGDSVALSVNQQGTADIVNFKDNNTSALIVKDGGTVGINTSTPSSSYKLDVNGNSNVSSGVYQAGFLLVPPGSIMPYVASSAPGGWLLCDGQSVSTTTYATLFSLIGYTYGGSGGSFNLPNMKGRMIVGFNSSDSNFDSLGETGGSKTATLTTNELPAHTHTGTTDSSGSHSHTYNDAYFAEAGGSGSSIYGTNAATDADNNFRWRTAAGGSSLTPEDINTSTGGAHTHTFTTASSGSGNSFSIMNPYITLNYIIKY
jgi:microcystin-dependent protein